MTTAERAKIAVQLTLDGASAVQKHLAGITRSAGAFGRGFATANQQLFYGMQNAMAIAGSVKNKFDEVLSPAIQADSWREQFQFIGLSADEAKKKIKDLLGVSKELEQPHADVVGAFLTLSKMGDKSMLAPDSMREISDAAKYANTTFAEMAQRYAHVSEMMQQGKGFAFAARSFREMQLISGETMKKIEELDETFDVQKAADRLKDLQSSRDDDIKNQRTALQKIEERDFGQSGSGAPGRTAQQAESVMEARRKLAELETSPTSAFDADIADAEAKLKSLQDNPAQGYEKVMGMMREEIRKKIENVGKAGVTLRDTEQIINDALRSKLAEIFLPVAEAKNVDLQALVKKISQIKNPMAEGGLSFFGGDNMAKASNALDFPVLTTYLKHKEITDAGARMMMPFFDQTTGQLRSFTDTLRETGNALSIFKSRLDGATTGGTF